MTTYKQIIEPNVSQPGLDGFSLSYVVQVFNGINRYATATEAWEKTQFKHTDIEELPDAYVPVWFKSVLDLGRGVENVGHVGWWDWQTQHVVSTGRNGAEWVTLEALSRRTDGYLGWSEDIAGVRIVEPTKEEIRLDNREALITHIEHLQRTIRMRNERIAELEKELKAPVDLKAKAQKAVERAYFKGWNDCHHEAAKSLNTFRSEFSQYSYPQEQK